MLARMSTARVNVRLCAHAIGASREIMDRARDEGLLRAEVTDDDLLHVFAASAAIARATETSDPGAWRRHVAFVLDGFRAPE
ncbi:SbtR family transcriptional regulator [Marinitenerispora sediminis]|uniref:SbtR family transcriptional regulator n=1 Tax=Marinitenerispora sediminis TaxID=1931232 RepID=UPI0015F1642C|nr:hypothetical protein [Marinitenerispora sediminis]